MDILAQQPGASVIPDWSALVGQLGVVAALVWYLWYRTAYADPAKDAAHRETIEAICTDFTDTIKEERIERRAMVNELRDSFRCANRPGESGVIR